MYLPQRRGILGNILAGAQTVLGIANTVKAWQAQSSLQEGRNLESIASKIKLAQAINPNQPVSLNEGLGAAVEKAGIPVPRLTPERITQAQDASLRSAPGDVTLPVSQQDVGGMTTLSSRGTPITVPGGKMTVSTGGKATPLSEIPKRQEQAQTLAKSLGPVGGYAPIMPQGKKLAIVDYAGGVRTQDLPPGVSSIIQQKEPKQENVIFDREGKPIAKIGNVKPHWLPKKDKTPEELAAEAKARAQGRWAGTPEIETRDPDTDLVTRRTKRKPVYTKSPNQGGVTFVTPQQAREAQQSGQKLPKGTRILKDTEVEDWNKARGRAVSLIRGQFDLNRPGQKEKMDKAIDEQTQIEFGMMRSKRGGGSGGKVGRYQLPQNGEMVNVDKATYDAYWAFHGGKK